MYSRFEEVQNSSHFALIISYQTSTFSGCVQNTWGWAFFSLQGERQKIISVNLAFFSLTEWSIFHFCGNVSSGNTIETFQTIYFPSVISSFHFIFLFVLQSMLSPRSTNGRDIVKKTWKKLKAGSLETGAV
jgi:hypothetical protein